MADTKGERTRERIISTAAPVFNRLGMPARRWPISWPRPAWRRAGCIVISRARKTSRSRRSIMPSACTAIAFAPMWRGGAHRRRAARRRRRIHREHRRESGGGRRVPAAQHRDRERRCQRSAVSRAAHAHATRDDALIGLVRDILADGMSHGEFRKGLDADAEASGIVAMLEGALMLSKLYDDGAHAGCRRSRSRPCRGIRGVGETDAVVGVVGSQKTRELAKNRLSAEFRQAI